MRRGIIDTTTSWKQHISQVNKNTVPLEIACLIHKYAKKNYIKIFYKCTQCATKILLQQKKNKNKKKLICYKEIDIIRQQKNSYLIINYLYLH